MAQNQKERSMTGRSRTQRSLELHYEELERLRKMAKHNDIGIAAALHFCASEDVPPPGWLVIAASRLLNELLRSEVSSKRGRAAGRVARYRQDQIRYERACAVDWVRSLRTTNKEDLKRLKQWRKEQSWTEEEESRYGRHIEKTRDWLRHGLYECASMVLRNTEAFGGVHAVRKSYLQVKRAEQSPEESFRYYVSFGDFFKQVGLEWPSTTKPGTKFKPFYDLTP